MHTLEETAAASALAVSLNLKERKRNAHDMDTKNISHCITKLDSLSIASEQ